MVANFYEIIFPREIGGYQQIRNELRTEMGATVGSGFGCGGGSSGVAEM